MNPKQTDRILITMKFGKYSISGKFNTNTNAANLSKTSHRTWKWCLSWNIIFIRIYKFYSKLLSTLLMFKQGNLKLCGVIYLFICSNTCRYVCNEWTWCRTYGIANYTLWRYVYSWSTQVYSFWARSHLRGAPVKTVCQSIRQNAWKNEKMVLYRFP